MCKQSDAQWKNFLLKNRQNVVANVTKYRTEAGLKKKELAEIAGLAPVVITKIENKEGSLELETIFKVAYGLKVPPYLLLFHPEDEIDLDFYELNYRLLESMTEDEKKYLNNRYNKLYPFE